jgi:hypothetical protein
MPSHSTHAWARNALSDVLLIPNLIVHSIPSRFISAQIARVLLRQLAPGSHLETVHTICPIRRACCSTSGFPPRFRCLTAQAKTCAEAAFHPNNLSLMSMVIINTAALAANAFSAWGAV